MKKIVAFMGSPRREGNSAALLSEAARGAREAGAEVRIYYLNAMNIRPCQACMLCRREYACSLKDDMAAVYADLKDAYAVILGSPVYMFGVTAQTKLLLDRLFPVFGPDFAPRNGKKKTLLMFSQGNPDKDAFSGNKPGGVSSCFRDTGKLLAFMGLEQTQAPLVLANANDPDTAKSDKELLRAAYEAGKKLAE